MKIIYLFMAVVFVFILGCNGDKTNFTVRGKIVNSNKEKIVLNNLKIDEIVGIDSVNLNDDGEFKLSGSTDIPLFLTLSVEKKNPIYLIVHPGDDITINTDINSFDFGYMVKGSYDTQLVKDLVERQKETVEKLIELAGIYRKKIENSSNADSVIRERNNKRMEIIEEQRKITREFISKNPSSLASLMALYQYIDPQTPILHPDDDFEYFQLVDSVLIKLYPSSEAVKSLDNYVVRQSQLQKKVRKGMMASEIALPSPEGDTIRLSSLRGKYVLLDFWASWCPPCREENPNLVSLYKRFGGKDFEIYQVSIDKTAEAWKKAIESDKLDWMHVSELKFWQSNVVKLYGITQIPSNFLLDRDGKIIAVDLMGKRLEEELESLLSKSETGGQKTGLER